MNEKAFNKRALYSKMEEELGLHGVSDKLGKEPLEKIKPILIQAVRVRSTNTTPKKIREYYESQYDFYGISSISQKEHLEFGLLFYSVLPSYFTSVEVSPISPLGLNSVLTKISQDISLATIRGSEVISDPTTPLVLECAKRRLHQNLSRDSNGKGVIELATTKRVLRLQPFDKGKGYMQHFNLFGLCSGGNLKENTPIVVRFIEKHVSVWLDFIEKLRNNGYVFDNVTIKFSDIGFLEYIIKTFGLSRETIGRNAFNDNFDFIKEYNIPLPKEVNSVAEMIKADPENQYIAYGKSYLLAIEKLILGNLKNKYPNVKFSFDFTRKAGVGYYDGVCFHIFGSNYKGEYVQISDGGSVDWLAKLTSNNKESCVTSGFGAELIQKLFHPRSTES